MDDGNGPLRAAEVLGLRCRTCDAPFRVPGMRGAVEDVVARMLAVRCPRCRGRDVVIGEGRSLAEDRGFRTTVPADPSTVDVRLAEWLATGEVGASSLALASAATGRPDRGGPPSDTGDLRRCVLLLDRIPEWASTAPRAAAARDPDRWGSVASVWDDLVATFLRETGGTGKGAAPDAATMLDRALRAGAVDG